jgi:predicted dehydrogenase
VSPAPTSDLAAVIVGCGRIAGGFNEASEAQALTHAVSYRRLGIPIAGCCDVDPERARAFAERWGVERHGIRLEDVVGTEPVIVSVCTPPEAQPGLFASIVAFPNVRAVLLEKPLGATFAAARDIDRQARAWGRPVLVNYFRAFTSFYRDLDRRLRDKSWGETRHVIVHHAGTLQSHASHALERLVSAFGSITSLGRLAGAAHSFEVSFAGGPRAIFVALSGLDYSVFEIEVFCERARLRVVDSERRVELFAAAPDPAFPGYRGLEAAPSDLPEITHEMIEAVEAAVSAARAGRDESDVLSRAVEVARALDAAGGVTLSGS